MRADVGGWEGMGWIVYQRIVAVLCCCCLVYMRICVLFVLCVDCVVGVQPGQMDGEARRRRWDQRRNVRRKEHTRARGG